MAKKSKRYNYKIIWLIIIGVITLLSLLLIKNSQHARIISQANPSITPTKSLISYHSNFFDVTLDIPSDFSIKEQLPEVLFGKKNQIITMHKIGTNKIYKTTDEFLDDSFNTDNKPKNIEKKHINIHGIDAVEVTVNYPNSPEDNNKAYYFYINSGFYHIYTSSVSLYSDLNQIAQSFRYTP